MGVWERSALAMSGAEYQVQETLLAIQRLLDAGEIAAPARQALEGAAAALRSELGQA